MLQQSGPDAETDKFTGAGEIKLPRIVCPTIDNTPPSNIGDSGAGTVPFTKGKRDIPRRRRPPLSWNIPAEGKVFRRYAGNTAYGARALSEIG